MGNLNVAVLGPAGYAKDLGKKGTESDIIFYNLKKGGDTVTFIEPARYPERLAPLFYAASMADEALVVVSEITPIFGEWVLMLDEVGVERGSIILKTTSPSGSAPLLRGTVLENYEFVDDDPIALRERLIARARPTRPARARRHGTVTMRSPLQHPRHRDGHTRRRCAGGIRKHDAMTVYPGERAVTVRSIQKHDDDFDWAAEGDRGTRAQEHRGRRPRSRLRPSTDPPSASGRNSKRGQPWSDWPAPNARGMVLHLGHWMQFIPARVEAVQDDGDWRRPMLTLARERPCLPPGDRAVLHYLEGGNSGSPGI